MKYPHDFQKPTNPMKTRKSFFKLPKRAVAASVALTAALSFTPANASPTDLDGDGISNRVDPDVDGDGVLNGADRNVDGGICKKGPFKGKYVGDRLRNDDSSEKDIDGDGLRDHRKLELDIDGDRRKDDSAKEGDIDGDGRDDDSAKEGNIDGDDYGDESKDEKDIDGDGILDSKDDDIDGDDIDNADDDDCDGDGKGRDRDDDDDGDNIDDVEDDDDDNDGFDDDEVSEIEVGLTPTAEAPTGSRVRVEIKSFPGDQIELDLKGRGLAAGSYDVVVNGVVLGQLVMEEDDDRTEGEVEFETNPDDDDDELALPFNPAGLPVSIVKDGITYFSGTVPAVVS